MAMSSPPTGDTLAAEPAPIDYLDGGRRQPVKVGELMDIEIEDFLATGSRAAKSSG
jgi:hypothetical protein